MVRCLLIASKIYADMLNKDCFFFSEESKEGALQKKMSKKNIFFYMHHCRMEKRGGSP